MRKCLYDFVALHFHNAVLNVELTSNNIGFFVTRLSLSRLHDCPLPQIVPEIRFSQKYAFHTVWRNTPYRFWFWKEVGRYNMLHRAMVA